MDIEYCVQGKLKSSNLPLVRAIFRGKDLIFGLGRAISSPESSEAALKKAYEQLQLRVKESTSALVKANNRLRRRIQNHDRELKKLLERTCRLRMAYNQAIIYAQALNKEIARRKRLEKKLRKKEELIKATFDSTADGILVINERGEITHTNRRLMEICRIPEELAAAKDSRRLLNHIFRTSEGPDDLSDPRCPNRMAPSDFETLHFEDGRIVERSSCPLIQDGQAAGRVWIFRDVTAPRLAVREHTQRKKLEGVLELAGAVCHEVNQPLQVLWACSEILLEAIPEDDPSHRQVTRILKSADVIAAITRKLHSITRYETKEYFPGIRIIDIDRASLSEAGPQ